MERHKLSDFCVICEHFLSGVYWNILDGQLSSVKSSGSGSC